MENSDNSRGFHQFCALKFENKTGKCTSKDNMARLFIIQFFLNFPLYLIFL